jgi:two-component system, OmpR family, sensor histidine kinase KdpD
VSSERGADRERPNPEELLDRYNLRDQVPVTTSAELSTDSHRPKRGKLRIYLGMAAGVGKTYAMLNEGHRRKARGTDVVIGYVETHHRPITEAQIGDLEVVPRRKLPYRNILMEEMDVDAVLARKPQVALVDELAHTNVVGSRNAKRYQDVEELLNAGITVIGTLNIQHLEGLNDIVESITGVRQRETLPDRVLDDADEVELIDIAPDALRARLRHGNVYPPEQAVRALDNYFSQSNLTALRELALRRTAEKTEEQLEVLMRGSERDKSSWGATATERVMVAFDARPHARKLLREGWRLAHALKAPLLAVTVERGGPLSAPDLPHEAAIAEYVRLATDLGAEVVRVRGGNVAGELARIARERHVTQIVIGQPLTTGLRAALFGSVVNRLLHRQLGADVHVVPDRAGKA